MSITCCFHFFFPSVPKFVHCSFSHIIMPIVFCAFLSVLCLSSSFLLITIHECISALYWPKIGCPQTCGAALEIFFTKHTISILGFTFLSIHMVCNSSKVLPYNVVHHFVAAFNLQAPKKLLFSWPDKGQTSRTKYFLLSYTSVLHY